MNDDTWIVVRNWDRFQSYDDEPAWIKLWLKLGSQPEWIDLPLPLRGLLVSVWIEYARSGQQLRVDLLRRLVTTNLGEASHLAANLEKLKEQGFLEFSTEKPSRARARVRAREEKRREEERAPARTREGAGARPQEELPPHMQRHPQNAPASPRGAASYVRTQMRIAAADRDPNLERTLRETYGVDEQELAELLDELAQLEQHPG